MSTPPERIRKHWPQLIPLAVLLGIGTGWLLRLGTRGAEIATVLALLVAVSALILVLLEKSERSDTPERPDSSRLPNKVLKWVRAKAKLIVPLLVLLLVALSLVATSRLWEPPLRVVVVGCAHPTELRMLTSPEQLEPVRLLANQFRRSKLAQPHGCASVHPYVFALPTKRARDALAVGWPNSALREAPRPDVWLADSLREVTKVREMPGSGSTAIVAPVTVAWSPIVLGVPAARVSELPGGSSGQSWSKLLEAIKDWDVVRPDPGSSPVAEAATALLYQGRTDIDARLLEQRIGLSLDQGKYPLGDSLDVLSHYRQSDHPQPTAVVVSEQALAKSNNGGLLGDTCATSPNDDDRLEAVYPSDTRSLDLQFVRLSWSQPPQADAAIEFGKWLESPEGRKTLAEVGLRSPGPIAGCLLTTQNGVQPDAMFSSDPVPDSVLNTAMGTYQRAQRPSRVLLALDSSGSMSALAGTGQGSRFDTASLGVKRALKLMGNQDELGLWVFPTSPNSSEVHRLEPIGRKDATQRPTISAALKNVRPAGDTPLYRTIVNGVATLEPSGEMSSHALVVLTDGEDTTRDLTDIQLVDAVKDKGVRIFVLTLGEVSCATAVLRRVTEDTRGRCLDADPSGIDIDTKLVDLFGVLWGEEG